METRLHGIGRADSASFLAQAIPAVQFTSGLHADYHQVTDEASKVDSEGGARIAWLAYRLLREMMDNPQRLRFRRPSPDFDVQGIIRLALRLGLVPEQKSQPGRHPLIRFVLPNSLAAKQGFRTRHSGTSVAVFFRADVPRKPCLPHAARDRELETPVRPKVRSDLRSHEPSEVGDFRLNSLLDFRFQNLGFRFLFRGQSGWQHGVSPCWLSPNHPGRDLCTKNTTNYSAAYLDRHLDFFLA